MDKVKVAFIGDSGVGKTSLLKRRIDNSFEDEDTNPTIGASCLQITENVSGQNVDLVLWDTAGQEKYKALSPLYIKNSFAIVFVYAINDENSFKSIKKWYDIAMDSLDSIDPYFILVANKNDLEDKKVTDEEGRNKAEEFKMDFLSVSARTGDAVNSIFENIAFSYLNKKVKLESVIESNSVDLANDQVPKKEDKSCC